MFIHLFQEPVWLEPVSILLTVLVCTCAYEVDVFPLIYSVGVPIYSAGFLVFIGGLSLGKTFTLMGLGSVLCLVGQYVPT